MPTQRQQFSITVNKLLANDQRLILLLGDIGTHAFRESFEQWPERCLNVGCTEGASVSLAAGLAKSGLMPIFSTIASFMVRRAYEQIMVGFGINELPGLFAIRRRRRLSRPRPNACLPRRPHPDALHPRHEDPRPADVRGCRPADQGAR